MKTILVLLSDGNITFYLIHSTSHFFCISLVNPKNYNDRCVWITWNPYTFGGDNVMESVRLRPYFVFLCLGLIQSGGLQSFQALIGNLYY